MNEIFIGFIAICVTIIVFVASKWINKKIPHPFTLPILLSTIIIVSGLLIFNISYDMYYIGAQWIDRLLGPAVVALAFPLYKQRQNFKKYLAPILIGVIIGSSIGVLSGLLMGKWLNLDHYLLFSLLPKSVTTPVAMDITYSLGGSPSLAAILVIVAGIFGAVLGPSILRWIRVDHPLAKGIGMGSASHAIGTARSMEESVNEGTASTIAMVLCAMIVSMITPLFVMLFI